MLWRALMVSAAGMHFAIAWSLWELLGPLAWSPGLVLLRRLVPDEIWPLSFALIGVLALVGMVSLTAARLHFALAAVLMVVWGIASLSLWPTRGPQPGGLLLLHVAFLKLVVAYYAEALRGIGRAADRLDEEVNQTRENLHEAAR